MPLTNKNECALQLTRCPAMTAIRPEDHAGGTSVEVVTESVDRVTPDLSLVFGAATQLLEAKQRHGSARR
jgi:hypothetical protein